MLSIYFRRCEKLEADDTDNSFLAAIHKDMMQTSSNEHSYITIRKSGSTSPFLNKMSYNNETVYLL
jgi:hypothetical protein